MECGEDKLVVEERGATYWDGSQAVRKGQYADYELRGELIVRIQGGVLKVPHPWQNQYSPGVENGKAYDEESIGLSSWHDRRKAGRGPVDTPAGRMTGHAGVTAT